MIFNRPVREWFRFHKNSRRDAREKPSAFPAVKFVRLLQPHPFALAFQSLVDGGGGVFVA